MTYKGVDLERMTNPSLQFKAEIKSVQMNKLASLDREYKIVLVTDDERILELGTISPDTIVDVTIAEEK